jgi:hypothetical protein
MASKYIQKFPIPDGFPEIIHDLSKEILRNQPEDIIEFCALYFKCLQEGTVLDYSKKGKNIPCDFKTVVPSVGKKPEQAIMSEKEEKLHQEALERSRMLSDNPVKGEIRSEKQLPVIKSDKVLPVVHEVNHEHEEKHEEHRHVEHKAEEHRHEDHRSQEHIQEEHKSEEDRKEEHKPEDHRQEENRQEEHKHEENRQEEHKHEENRQEENRQEEHKHEDYKHDSDIKNEEHEYGDKPQTPEEFTKSFDKSELRSSIEKLMDDVMDRHYVRSNFN